MLKIRTKFSFYFKHCVKTNHLRGMPFLRKVLRIVLAMRTETHFLGTPCNALALENFPLRRKWQDKLYFWGNFKVFNPPYKQLADLESKTTSRHHNHCAQEIRTIQLKRNKTSYVRSTLQNWQCTQYIIFTVNLVSTLSLQSTHLSTLSLQSTHLSTLSF